MVETATEFVDHNDPAQVVRQCKISRLTALVRSLNRADQVTHLHLICISSSQWAAYTIIGAYTRF